MRLLKEVRAELDEAKRYEMFVECQRNICDEGGVIIPLFGNWIETASKKLRFENIAENLEIG